MIGFVWPARSGTVSDTTAVDGHALPGPHRELWGLGLSVSF